MTRTVRSVVAVSLLWATAAGAAPSQRPPSLVFLLLDTTRADRLSAWGNPNRTTPALDRLARDGVRFARHFANSHATRPSMPQLLSGRYYQASVLRPFRSRTHPRDWPFAAADPTLALLPEILAGAGYYLAAVSAHPWVSRDSRFGAPFDLFEEPDVPAKRGHPSADVIVNRAVEAWRSRPRDRPTLLYLHFMDAHIPRWVPPGALRFGHDDPTVRARFDHAGEPRMPDPWRDWDRSRADAFSPADVAFFTAVYDTMLARIDDAVARLLDAIRTDDPTLAHTLVVVTADHGEELGEHGRISHEASLADAVQHIPWIVAGAGVLPGQTAWGVTENIDVVPTTLSILGIAPPASVAFDGRPMLIKGRLCETCLRNAPVYAWEEYRAIRLGRRVLREALPQSFTARCRGERELLDPTRWRTITDRRRMRGGTALLGRTLDGPERAFRRDRFGPAHTSFSVLPPFWRLAQPIPINCLEVGPHTTRDQFQTAGWIWTGRGLTIQHGAPTTPPLPLLLEVPDGEYDVSLGVRALPAPPRLFGYARWLRRGIRRRQPSDWVRLGRMTALGRTLRVDLPAEAALHRHVVALTLEPVGAGPAGQHSVPTPDPALHDRLRALGYVD